VSHLFITHYHGWTRLQVINSSLFAGNTIPPAFEANDVTVVQTARFPADLLFLKELTAETKMAGWRHIRTLFQ
jgi:hypothetical protein